jgi:hypothetical protein
VHTLLLVLTWSLYVGVPGLQDADTLEENDFFTESFSEKEIKETINSYYAVGAPDMVYFFYSSNKLEYY